MLFFFVCAKILTGIVVHDKVNKTPKIVEFKASEVNKLLGITDPKKGYGIYITNMLEEMEK